MEYGPVDVIIVATATPSFDGSILAELEKVAATGFIRVLDAMVLGMDAEGAVFGVDLEDLPAEEKAKLGFVETGTRGLFDAEDSAMIAEGLVPGSIVIALAIEHAWATGLINALYQSGAEVGATMRIPADVVNERFAALAAGN
jgi:hypothetical protein